MKKYRSKIDIKRKFCLCYLLSKQVMYFSSSYKLKRFIYTCTVCFFLKELPREASVSYLSFANFLFFPEADPGLEVLGASVLGRVFGGRPEAEAPGNP